MHLILFILLFLMDPNGTAPAVPGDFSHNEFHLISSVVDPNGQPAVQSPNQPPGELEGRLAAMAEEQLSESYENALFKVEVRWLSSRLREVDPGQIRSVRIDSREIPRALVTAQIHTEQGKLYPVQYYVRTSIRVPVARRNLEKGETLNANMIDSQSIDITRFQQLPLLSDEFRQKKLRRNIATGEPIYPADIESVPVVDRGEPVTMKYNENGLTIELNCESRVPGAPGDMITVHCSETGKRYETVILNDSTVEWRKTF